MKYQHRLVCLLIAMMMTFSCMLPCFASAAEDWVLFNVIMSWTDAEGTALSVQAQPVESSNVEIFWAQLPEDAPLNQQLEYIVNHPDHLYNVKCVFGPGELLTEYPEQFSPDTANMIFQLFDPSDLWTPCDQLYVYFSTLPLPEEPIPCVGFSEESAEEPAAEQPTEVPAEEPAAEQPTEAPAEEPAAEQPTEAPAEEPAAEQPTEVPAEEPAAEPAETSSVNPEELTFPIWGQTATNKVNVRETPGGKQIAQIANAETYVWLIGAESKDSITWYHLMWEDTHAKVREGYIRSDLIAPLSQEDSDLYQSSLPSPVPVMTDAPITAEPVEEPAEEPTETPAEEPAAEPIETPAEEPAAEPTEAPAEEPAAEPTKAPAEEPAAEPTEAPAEEPAEAPVEEPAEEPVEAPAEEPANNPEDLNYPIWGRTTAKKVIVRKAPAGKQIAQIADPETHVWLIGFEVKDSTTWYHVMWEDTRSDVREGFIRSDLISALSQEDSDAYQLSLPSPMPVMTPAPLADAVTSEEPAEPTEVPAEEPAAEPTEVPAEEPAAEPTEAPAEEPAAEPTEVPTEEPAAEPTEVPAEEPTAEPTEAPTEEPAAEPTEVPVEEPAAAALAKAPVEPTVEPTAAPTAEPTAAPTAEPTAAPTAAPTAEPTAAPTAEPTAAPTAEPTAAPTAEPTAAPTAEPTAALTAEPTAEPTAAPITGHARVIQDTTIHSTPNEKSVLLDPLTQEDVVVVLGQTVDQETDWTWHQIQYGSTTGYVRADTLTMMTDAEYSAYVNRTPEPTQTPEITATPDQATAQAVLTAQPRSTWAGTPVPAVWVEAEEPTPVPTTFATAAPTETPEPAASATPTVAPTEAPVVTEAPTKAAGQSSTGILVGVAALVILICAAGFVIYKRRRH
ncbi:MAG: PT domain-containing protein [Clostridia bacterium]|nr:PT domain-containing protein [Clostridia bacterium]